MSNANMIIEQTDFQKNNFKKGGIFNLTQRRKVAFVALIETHGRASLL
ncbi:MAG: hypothetical protein VSS75_004390 [Candidatus Parabeggiatoa sp.]|nr:hypothetical protein [Candidatus Parabeggiatoa sp.]